MEHHEDDVRERMERDADIMRGLGQSYGLGTEDMRYYGRALDEAVLMDSEGCWEEHYARERQEYDQLNRELMEGERNAPDPSCPNCGEAPISRGGHFNPTTETVQIDDVVSIGAGGCPVCNTFQPPTVTP